MIVGHRISEQKAADLLGFNIEVLKRWEKQGIVLYRICNHKRIYYLEDILNYQMRRGLPTARLLGILSSSPPYGQRKKGGGPGKVQ